MYNQLGGSPECRRYKKYRNYMVTNLKVTISSVYLPFVVNGKSTVGSYSLVDFSVLGLAKDTGGD